MKNRDQKLKEARIQTLKWMNEVLEKEELFIYASMTEELKQNQQAPSKLNQISLLWEELFPEKTHLAKPYRKKEEIWKGVDLPPNEIEEIKISNLLFKDDLLLIILKAGLQPFFSRPALKKLFKWALASNFNPNYFNGYITSVGFAAYSVQFDFLKILHASGADLVLEIKPEHVSPNMTTPAGSTLLHRLVEREFKNPKYQEMILFLMDVYKNPSPVDSQGNTPLSLASENFKPMIEEKLAELEKNKLKKIPRTQKKKGPINRL